MPHWKLDEIPETTYVVDLEEDSFGTKSLTPQKVENKIANPSVEELWFYHIDKKNFDELEQMLNEKVITIDAYRPLDGETLAHDVCLNGDLELFDFCIKHNANFLIKSQYEEESALYSTVWTRINFEFFKKVWSQFDDETVFIHLTELDGPEVKLIHRLCRKDKNIEKFKWLETQFPIAMSKFKSDKKEWDSLIDHTIEFEAEQFTFYLKGLQKLKNDLEQTLLTQKQGTKRTKL